VVLYTQKAWPRDSHIYYCCVYHSSGSHEKRPVSLAQIKDTSNLHSRSHDYEIATAQIADSVETDELETLSKLAFLSCSHVTFCVTLLNTTREFAPTKHVIRCQVCLGNASHEKTSDLERAYNTKHAVYVRFVIQRRCCCRSLLRLSNPLPAGLHASTTRFAICRA
jgi:hypothetical protein